MSNHHKHQEPLLQSAPLLDSTEELPLDLLESAIEADIFSIPLGSHPALHKLHNELRRESLPLRARKTIESTLKSPSIRQKIYANWNIWPDSRHAVKAWNSIDGLAPLDLASWASKNCTGCFDLLLDCGAVSPASFSQKGYGFFRLAYMGRHYDLTCKLVTLMKPEDILGPFSMNPGDPIMSVFEVSTLHRQVFQACWARLKPLANNGLDSLRPAEVGRICRFANPPLADDLKDSGLDLGKPISGDASLSWYNAAARQDPEVMLDWLLTRAEPPGDLLAIAAQNNYIPAAGWIMKHTRSYDGWRKGAQEAANCHAKGAERMLRMILGSPFAKRQADRTLLEDLTIITVERAYEDGKRLQIQGPDDSRQHLLADIEELAVQKIEVLREKSPGVAVVGLKVKAEEVGMHDLEAALGVAGTI